MKSEFDTPESDFDLTEAEAEAKRALESIYDKPLVPVEKRKDQMIQEYRSLAVDARKLQPRQRLFLRHLIANQGRAAAAVRKMNAAVPTEHRIKQQTARDWMRRGNFRSIVDRYMALSLQAAGITSPAQILLRIDGVVENALEPVPMYHNGQPLMNPETGTVQKEVDRGAALKGLEMLGKAAGVFRKDEENSQRVTVVLDFSGEQMQGEQQSEVVDAEVVR